jgi:peptide deformylase
MILPIRKIGDPILEKPCEEVNIELFEKLQRRFSLKTLVNDMIETARAHNAAGLAANQVGESLRIFVFKKYPLSQRPSLKNVDTWEIVINPSIIVGHEKKFLDWEGCLSVPKIEAEVPRYPNITLFYYNEKGEKKKLETSGLTARVIQHEQMHLEGRLFLETATSIRYVK